MEKIIPWMALKNIPGVGSHLFKCLIDGFQTPESVFRASPQELMGINGVSKNLAETILAPRAEDDLKREVELALKLNCRFVTLSDPRYPALLRQIHDPPPFIYVKGNLDNTENSVAVVGARQASTYGVSTAKRLGMDLASLGITVVSGMARGIDAAAQEGALLAGGKTIAVLGSGLGVIYPPENQKLFHQIAESGAVISEFPVMEQPNSYNFPARNRIIAGMTLGTVVVEAAQRSGSLITARLAAEQGREVFAVPGSIHSSKSNGTHNLLKQGAKLVASVQDIIEEFPRFKCSPAAADTQEYASGKINKPLQDMTAEESRVYNLLDSYPIHIDDLSQKAGLGIGRISGILLNLELKGIISQMPGKYFCLSEASIEQTASDR